MAELFKEKPLLNKSFVQEKYFVEREYLEDEPEVPILHDCLIDKVIGVYFSASWCPPSKEFTPLLVKLYDEIRRRGSKFEVVFVSFDKTEENMIKYYREDHGDWLAVPFNSPLIGELKEKYEINMVPKLIILKPDGSVITSKGRKDVQDKGIITFRNWLETANIKEVIGDKKAEVVAEKTDQQIDAIDEIKSVYSAEFASDDSGDEINRNSED